MDVGHVQIAPVSPDPDASGRYDRPDEGSGRGDDRTHHERGASREDQLEISAGARAFFRVSQVGDDMLFARNALGRASAFPDKRQSTLQEALHAGDFLRVEVLDRVARRVHAVLSVEPD